MDCNQSNNDSGWCVKGILERDWWEGKNWNPTVFSRFGIVECLLRRHDKLNMGKFGNLYLW